ncbi:hypothetical protein BJX99DRAFT_227490 [Aspergillus californicus]
MAPSPKTSSEYRLPEVTPESNSSWGGFLDLGDRSNIRYEQAPSNDHFEQPEQSAGEGAADVGLGIFQQSPAADKPTHSRCVSYDDTASLAPPDQTPSRFANSETTLLGDNPHAATYPTQRTITQRRLSWIPATILVLGFYSTIVSGLYLVVAFLKPRYGKFIGVDGKVAPTTASLLSTLFAKTVELAYVTVCVAFLGQVLTRRAITRGSHGISIADMSMRTWIMQPGSMIVHWESLRYSGWTILGAITLTATLVAMLYTTAAEALVTPKLKWGPTEDRILVGNVRASFANTQYLANHCETSVPIEVDVEYRNTTCLDMKHAGQAYHNYQAFIHQWSLVTDEQIPSSTNLTQRPRPTGSINDNTTVTGSWIDKQDMTQLWQRYGRFVQNVTAAMPHAGVIAAAMLPDNDITQPKDLSGEGNYELEASVPSPTVNVLCVGMNATELAPLVYSEWPNGAENFDPITWTAQTTPNIPGPAEWHNRTVVDDIFRFGPEYPGSTPPIFGKLPKEYNTVLNVTGDYATRDSIYLLGASRNGTEPEYVLCSLKAKQSPLCSTRYNVADSGSQLVSLCEEDRPMQYSVRLPNDSPDGFWVKDWMNVASEWGFSLSLNAGITDGASANARLLMQFVPTGRVSLDPLLPSISEALAVLAGNTLLMSTTDAPFVHFWNYTVEDNVLPEPVTQAFNASLRSVEYTSGRTQRWQGVFYPILIFAFLTSAICLAFMILEVRGKQVTDFTEPQNLFALAMNSPSTARLQGVCPEKGQLKERFYFAMEEDAQYYVRTKAEDTPRDSVVKKGSFVELDLDDPAKRGSLQSSPAIDEYRKLASRKSWLSRFY